MALWKFCIEMKGVNRFWMAYSTHQHKVEDAKDDSRCMSWNCQAQHDDMPIYLA
jgi:hypothetical protein